MFEYPNFEIEIRRAITRDELRWPSSDEALSEANLEGNRSYSDLRGLDWDDAHRILDLEKQLIERLESSLDANAEYCEIEEELYEDDEGLFGLDIGVAAAVIALCAAGCVTCSSCNAGAFGGSHHESHPLVAFFAKANQIELLLESAAEASVGLECSDGAVIAFGDIRNMHEFAGAILRRHAHFRAVNRIQGGG